MKSLLNKFSAGLLTTCVMVVGLQDLLEPIYSFGGYFVFIFGAFFIYILLLARKYKSAEELIEKEKAFAHLPHFQAFYQVGWRGPVIGVFFLALLVSAAGAYATHRSADKGGVLASSYPAVSSLQQALEDLLKGQYELRGAVDSVKRDTENIKAATDTIIKKTEPFPVSKIVQEAKASSDPYSVVRNLFPGDNVKMEGNIDDLLYLASVIGERKDKMLSLILAVRAFTVCEPGSFPERSALQIANHIRSSGGSSSVYHWSHTFDRFVYCVGERNLTSATLSEIYFPDGNFSYIGEEALINHMAAISQCAESLPVTLAQSVVLSRNSASAARSFVKYFDENSSPCVNEEFLSILRDKASPDR